MHEHTVELTTPLGLVTVTFSKGRLTGSDVATVSTGRGFGICSHEYSGVLCLSGPGWTEVSPPLLHDVTFADPEGKHPFPRDRAAMVGVIRAAIADYAAQARTSGRARTSG
jgi:hypothetical protein